MSDEILQYICSHMAERSIATGHASTCREAIDTLLEAYDEQRDELAAMRDRYRWRFVDIDGLPKKPGAYQVIWSHRPDETRTAYWTGTWWESTYTGDADVYVTHWCKYNKPPRTTGGRQR